MDIIYPVIKNWNNEELRYSLRSLANVKHDRVYLIGHKPSRATNVRHIPFEDNGNAYDNVMNKLRLVANQKDISNIVLIMNDDMYILQKITKHINYISWSLKDFAKYYDDEHANRCLLQAVRTPWDSFETHTPFYCDKDRLKIILDMEWVIQRRSAYWNLYNLPRKYVYAPNYRWNSIKDCKWYANNYKGKVKLTIRDDQMFLSSDDSIDWIPELFPTKSIYEL